MESHRCTADSQCKCRLPGCGPCGPAGADWDVVLALTGELVASAARVDRVRAQSLRVVDGDAILAPAGQWANRLREVADGVRAGLSGMRAQDDQLAAELAATTELIGPGRGQ